MATTTQTGTRPHSSGASSIEAGLEKLIEPALYVAGGVLAAAFVLPRQLASGPRLRLWKAVYPTVPLVVVRADGSERRAA